ncbi:MAG: phosphotransferase [Gemmataceae bacterium]|nr:phosphotransferase [Gemmataceae bacterium]
MTPPMPLDISAHAVLRHYPAPLAGELVPLGNRGGFSGARLWRVGGRDSGLCLRAWPEVGPSLDRLETIHALMAAARRAGLTFVPTVLPTAAGRTWVKHAGRLWELTSWMPGVADFHQCPTPARLEAACTALAHLHLVWANAASPPGPCPAVRRRLRCAADWAALVASGWRPHFPTADPIRPDAERAWPLIVSQLPTLVDRLHALAGSPLPLQPCLCDVWHDHVLFEGERVCGLVDYGSVKIDHVAVDLARLLGSLVPDDAGRTAIGLAAYNRLRPLAPQDVALVAVLDETGTLLGAANWLRGLYHDDRPCEDRAAVAARLNLLVTRLERWAERGAAVSTME